MVTLAIVRGGGFFHGNLPGFVTVSRHRRKLCRKGINNRRKGRFFCCVYRLRCFSHKRSLASRAAHFFVLVSDGNIVDARRTVRTYGHEFVQLLRHRCGGGRFLRWLDELAHCRWFCLWRGRFQKGSLAIDRKNLPNIAGWRRSQAFWRAGLFLAGSHPVVNRAAAG